jgi:hypothetical protein
MIHPIPTVRVTSEQWSEPVVINAADFDPAIHKKVDDTQKKRGRPRKVKET